MADKNLKTAVILFNLGGPDSKTAIRPFLMNFFMDKNIIRLPWPFRYALAKLISTRRSKREAGTSYGELGDKSPLLENSRAQAQALEKILNQDEVRQFKNFVCMRYWHPMAEEIAAKVRQWDADEIILLPLYPQFSTTTTRSSLQTWHKAVKAVGLHKPTATICCYPFNDGFIRASVDNIRKAYDQAGRDGYTAPRVLFSAHGLPESVITDGDPYRWQCEQGAQKIAHALNIPELDWAICYQSRVGRQKWIGPSTEDELRRAAKDGKAVVIYPHAFTQEHVETLVEIEIEYREVAEKLGLHGFYRAETVGTHPDFIQGLAGLVRAQLNKNNIAADGGVRLCPPEFNRCCMQLAGG